MTNTGTWADFAYFFRTWLSDPLRVAAVAPSGKALARIMTQEIRPKNGPVLELGPGTGAFTRALLEKGIEESDLTLVEFGSEFREILEKRFPQSRVLLMDAAELAQNGIFEGAPVSAVVSGLPLLSMPAQKVTDILAGAFHYLREDGAFYQFTYGPRCPVPQRVLDRLDLNATHIGRAVCNLPPAAVYRITRR
ncbi:methyltransferase domain-containing protein [Phyllobacterium sp. P30BS-XVII]|uniref:class I SAM-dependent methyltransferase n=1 Tax=Phyllobacterium sp. P30BS-XVII TaxID=2587046 RepID=UPI0015FC2C89|nr:methyltransferase domain-containing protein [Phyllobacterium sp. P30BS-XVII]MBA8903593.1 phospholipid N-methyltransferase [Phyllobacterium sp. P30BS-XVII]